MQRGFLLETARQHAKGILKTATTVGLLALLILLFNYTYVYNWLAGPFPLTPVIADGGTNKEFVRTSGDLTFTGIVEEKTSTVRLLRGLVENRQAEISADYFAITMEDRIFIVKTKHDFSGRSVQGRLIPLSNSTEAVLKEKISNPDLKNKELYPMMLDAASISYRADANLFVLVAAALLPFSVLLFLFAIPSRKNPEKHKMMRYIARQGPVLSTIPRVEQEFLALGDKGRVGPLRMSESWIFDGGGDPVVFQYRDIVRVGKRTKEVKSKPPAHSVEFWLREDSLMSHTVKAGSSECDAIMRVLAERVPWAIAEDDPTYDRRWRSDRKGCIAETEARKRQHENATAAASARASQPASTTTKS